MDRERVAEKQPQPKLPERLDTVIIRVKYKFNTSSI